MADDNKVKGPLQNRQFFGDGKNILDERKTVFDRIEDLGEEQDSVRPIREAAENATDSIPEGPFGKAGDGDLIGVAGYYAISTGQVAVLPIPGIRQPGYKVISHGVEAFDEYERHTVQITAASEHVARVAAEYAVSAPSNIDWASSEVETVSVQEIKSRSTFSTWEFEVDVADRGQEEF